MPTIALIGKFRIMIYLNDHAPAHVHCIGPDVEIVFELETMKVIRSHNAGSNDIKLLKEFIKSRRGLFKEQWELYHGKK